ncbi:T9SS type A sorting domain-containing protein [Dyadobacter sp. 32]|uniref:T9SS type A sorting domain-containing protein n=1 Tax=Dyadobacter sp. 32 TaxID=538966 RepID=UPI0011EEF887
MDSSSLLAFLFPGFRQLTTLKGNGSNKGSDYSYLDKDAQPGIALYYRLKMVDKDGTFAYSRIVTAQLAGEAMANIYPNPARTFVNVTASQPISEVQLINLSGVTMMSKNFNGTNKKEPWTFGAIIPGAYQVKIITTNGSVQYKKVIVTE